MRIGLILWSAAMFLAASGGTAYLSIKVVLPDGINVDAILNTLPLYKLIFYLVLVAALQGTSFFMYYFAYMTLKIALNRD